MLEQKLTLKATAALAAEVQDELKIEDPPKDEAAKRLVDTECTSQTD